MTQTQRKPSPYPELGLVIAGNFTFAENRNTIKVFNPTTGDILGMLPVATENDVDTSLSEAWNGFLTWSSMSAIDRGNILHKAARLMREDKENLADLITYELGKPYFSESLPEIEQAAGMFEWYAEEGRRSYGRVIPSRDGSDQFSYREPVGPIAAFSSWNAPSVTPSRKIAGALAAGCSVILKGSEETPATTLAIARYLEKAGLPKGVVSVLFGDPLMISEKLLTSDIIRGVTFTGSTYVGRQLASKAVYHMKRPIFELGGHAPVLIFDDIDIEKTAKAAVTAKYRNSGQICTCPTRFLIQDSIFEAFTDVFTSITKEIVLGDGFNPATQMGPLGNKSRIPAIEKFIEDAHARKITITTGGKRHGDKGYFFEPTVMKNVPLDAMAHNVEPFGPLAVMTKFPTIDDALTIANRLPFGLASYVFTNDINTAKKASKELQAGNVIINHWRVSYPETPFGGVQDSGLGNEGGIEGLQAFQNIKYVSHK
ncbi:MAG: NAD-dependent succinate-semialdehyde dehydrogenase [Methylocystaceae bacterium]|nr:NAD-dependent succinate-semialdehyde dehydrogenase [Methylocystaceae bacterium]